MWLRVAGTLTVLAALYSRVLVAGGPEYVPPSLGTDGSWYGDLEDFATTAAGPPVIITADGPGPTDKSPSAEATRNSTQYHPQTDKDVRDWIESDQLQKNATLDSEFLRLIPMVLDLFFRRSFSDSELIGKAIIVKLPPSRLLFPCTH